MQSRTAFICVVFLAIALTGCGGGGSSSSDPAADFTVAIAPLAVTLTTGGSSQAIDITASSVNGFTGNVNVTVGPLPTGITVSPMTLSVAPGSLQQLTVTAGPTAAAGNTNITLQATSGSLTHSISAAVAVNALTSASLSATSFDYGNDLVNNAVTKSVATVTNTGAVPLTLNPALSGDASYALVSTGSCGAQLAPAASCAVMVSYTPTVASAPATQNAVLNLGFGDVPAGTPQTVALSGTSAALPAGQVTATNNPQVALYTMTLPFPGSMTVNFGKDTTYGLKTWAQSTPESGGQVSIFVAGMQASTTYHMQAAVQLANGISANDVDHSFTTQAVPANMKGNFTATTSPGMTPQSGVELLNPLDGNASGVLVTDLAANILWAYASPGGSSGYTQGVKLLPNGDFLMAIGANSSNGLTQNLPAYTIAEIREVNLGGDTVREISIADLNAALTTATCAECNVNLYTFHHDVEPLPNGHWLVLANTAMNLSPTTTPPLTNTAPAYVLGDVIVDLDENLNPVWVWNEFNHMDPNRHPYMFPDWTHTNAVTYSPDDGNILVSIRHQNWVVKVDYEDGKGSGAILWRLGEGGDFTLKGGTDPTDWQYAQHMPNFFSTNTTGVFSLGMMDNGDDRIFPVGVTCGAAGAPPCLYTTIPIYQIDENAKMATLIFHQILPANLYSNFGGNTGPLANGNVEYDLCGVGPIGAGSYVYEVTNQSTPQTVWTLQSTGANLYRAFRMPSFYPGVQW